MARVSPGTRLREVEDAVIRATAAVGRGATIGEIREAHAAEYEQLRPANLDKALSKLESAGRILKIGGRHRRTQWAHVEHPVPFQDELDVAPLLVEIVRALFRKHRRALETREIVSELGRRQSAAFSQDQIRNRLESLAHASDRKAARTTSEWSEPSLRRISELTNGGRNRVLWLPAGQDGPPPEVRDASNAVRRVVNTVSGVLGRPASRREILLWAQAQRGDERGSGGLAGVNSAGITAVFSSSFRSRLAASVVLDEARGSEEGRIQSVRTPFSGRGHYPVRFTGARLTESGANAGLVEDLAYLLRPSDELAGIQRLKQEAEQTGSALLMEIACAREAALVDAFLRNAPGLASESLLQAACSVAQDARMQVSEWARLAARGRAALDDRDPGVDGFVEVLRLRVRREPTDTATLRGVDQAAGVRIADLEDLGMEVLQIGDRPVRYWSPHIAGARRLRGPQAGGVSCEDPSETESVLDRPDALSALASATGLPVIGSLVAGATNVLGLVLRDADVVRDWLARATAGDPGLRQSLVVALGLLGGPAPIELTWPDTSDPEQAVAYFASLCLGVDGPGERVRRAVAAERWANGAAMEGAETALNRIESGCRLSVVG